MIRVPKKMTAAPPIMKFPALYTNRCFRTGLHRPPLDPVLRHLHAFSTLIPDVMEQSH